MRASIHLEVGHTMWTMCEKTSKLCQHCSNNPKVVALNSKEVKNNNKNEFKVKAREVPSTKKFDKKM